MRLKRLFFFWLLAFVGVYLLNTAMVVAWTRSGYNNIYLVVGTIDAPLVYLFFGWLYFRPGFAARLSQRIKNAIAWIVLDFLAGMALLAFIAHLSPWEMFTTASYLIEGGNFLALLVAGYACVKTKKMEKPVPSSPPTAGAARP